MPTREELMNLLCNFLQVAPPSITAADPGEVRLIQDPAAPTTFPHVVEIAGAPVHPGENNVWHGSRHHQEDAQWQQCATKMTRFGLRLVDRQGSMVKGQSPGCVLPGCHSLLPRLPGLERQQMAPPSALDRELCVLHEHASAFDYPGTAWISTAARYSRCVPHGAFRSGLARAESYNPIQALSLAYNNQGGLELKFTLQSVNGEQLSDAHNPRPREGLLAGSAKGPFEHTCAATSAWPSL